MVEIMLVLTKYFFNYNYKKNFFILLILIISCNNPSLHLKDSNIQNEKNLKNSTLDYEHQINSKALNHFLDGEMYFSQGDYSMAVIEFQDALRYDSSSASIYLSLAEVFLRLNKFERSEETLKAALLLNESKKEIRELLAQQYLMRGDIDLGEKQYLILESTYPNDIHFSFILAEISYRKGNIKSAQEKYWNIYLKDSTQIQALSRAAELSKINGEIEFSFKAFEKLVLIQPENLQFWKDYSELASSLKFFDKAIDGLNNLSRLTSDDPIIKERLGILYFEQNQFSKCDSIFSLLYNNGEISPGILYYKTRLAIFEQDFNSAEFFSSKQIELFPSEISGYTNLALSYINLKNSVDAISILIKAKNKFPSNFTINYMLGSAYNNQKKFELAIESLNIALKIEPNSRSTKHLLANAHNSIGQWPMSENFYKELINSDKKDAQALNNYSYTLAERGLKLKEALNMSQKAIELEPNNSAYLDTIGWIFYKLKKYNKAIDYIQKSISLDPNNIVVLEHLGDVYMKINKVEDAKFYYKKILDLDKSNSRVLNKINR
tara:strand:+ start:1303 stop:2952 length:1650 start_codon:yes stop_codon:yes gene_type:complete